MIDVTLLCSEKLKENYYDLYCISFIALVTVLGIKRETPNTKSKIILELPCYVFSFIVGLWFCKQVGII